MRMQQTVTILILLLLTACSTTSGLDPVVSKNGYDNSSYVHIVPHGNNCGMDMMCTGIGASWDSSQPSAALLTVQIINKPSLITSAEIKLNGKIIPLIRLPHATDLKIEHGMTETSKVFGISYAQLVELSNAKTAWLRVNTPTGYIDALIVNEQEDSKAYHALKRFVKAVNHNKE